MPSTRRVSGATDSTRRSGKRQVRPTARAKEAVDSQQFQQRQQQLRKQARSRPKATKKTPPPKKSKKKKAYKTPPLEIENLDNAKIFVGLSIHKKTSIAKFQNPYFLDGLKFKQLDGIDNESSFEELVSAIELALEPKKESDKKLILTDTTNANAFLFTRASKQKSNEVNPYQSQDIEPITNTEQWNKALLNISFHEYNEENVDCSSSEAEYPTKLYLDLLCTVREEAKRVRSNQIITTSNKKRWRSDEETSLKLFLLGPTTKVDQDGKVYYEVEQHKDKELIADMVPSNNQRINFASIFTTTKNHAVEDKRYKSVDGNTSYVHRYSKVFYQEDFGTKKMTVLKNTDDIWTHVNKRRKTKDQQVVELHMSVGKNPTTNEPYNTSDLDEDVMPSSQPDFINSLASPEQSRKKKKTSAEHNNETTNAITKSRNYVDTIMAHPDCEFYHALTREHYVDLYEYWSSMMVEDDHGNTQYIWDKYKCEPDQDDTWPKLADLPPHLDPKNPIMKYKQVPSTGKFPPSTNGQLPSYPEDPKETELMKIDAMKAMAGGGRLVATAINPKAFQTHMNVRVVNSVSHRSKSLLVEIGEQHTIFDTIYNNPSLMENKIRRWSSDYKKQIQDGIRTVKMVLVDNKTNNEDKKDLFVFTIKDMQSINTKQLYSMCFGNQEEPFVLELRAEIFMSGSDEDSDGSDI